MRWEDDPRSTEELIQASLEGDEDDEHAWTAIHVLRWRGTREVLEAALCLLESPSAKARGRGADILGQLGGKTLTFPTECGDALMGLLRRETEPGVLQSVGFALGHLRELRALDELIRLSHHPIPEVRHGAVHGLAPLESPRVIEALIRLSADEDRDVRDWAVFGLGTLREEADTPELRDALAARLGDEDAGTFGEAVVGLANRKDPRALEPTRAALSGDTVNVYALEAAGALGDPSLFPLLVAIRDSGKEADTYFGRVLEDVIARFEGESG